MGVDSQSPAIQGSVVNVVADYGHVTSQFSHDGQVIQKTYDIFNKEATYLVNMWSVW